VPLDFNLYCSVSPDEMRALERVVSAARELGVASASDDGSKTELAHALSVLDAVRTRRNGHNGRRAGTLVPWLHDYLRRFEAERLGGASGSYERRVSPRKAA
jgi:hypothetical protein